ncbi:MAG: hypothetical protein WAZ78_00730 [Candidatus Moraniibacteriota bacterium]
MKTICAWCGEHINGYSTEPDELVSHGLCETCKERVEKEIIESIEALIKRKAAYPLSRE